MEKKKLRKIEFPSVEIICTHTPLQKLQEECDCFFKKLDEIQLNAKRYDLLERYFFFHHEYELLLNSIQEYYSKSEFQKDLVFYANSCFNDEFEELKIKIRNSYGALNVQEYLESENCYFLVNPKLLGLAFLIFTKIELKKIIYHDILQSKYQHNQLDIIDLIIRTSYNDLSYRIIDDKRLNQLLLNHTISRKPFLDKVGFDLEELRVISSEIKTKSEWKKRLEVLIFDQKHKLPSGYTLRDLIADISYEFREVEETKKLNVNRAIKYFVKLHFKNYSGSNLNKVKAVDIPLILGAYDKILKRALIKQSKENWLFTKRYCENIT